METQSDRLRRSLTLHLLAAQLKDQYHLLTSVLCDSCFAIWEEQPVYYDPDKIIHNLIIKTEPTEIRVVVKDDQFLLRILGIWDRIQISDPDCFQKIQEYLEAHSRQP